jgi:hypothetical protein
VKNIGIENGQQTWMKNTNEPIHNQNHNKGKHKEISMKRLLFLVLIKKLKILLDLIHFHSRPNKHSLDRKQNMFFGFIYLFIFSINVIWAKTSLGDITKNHPKE